MRQRHKVLVCDIDWIALEGSDEDLEHLDAVQISCGRMTRDESHTLNHEQMEWDAVSDI
jgi:hypothetical protein